MGSMDTLAELARLLEKGDDLTERGEPETGGVNTWSAAPANAGATEGESRLASEAGSAAQQETARGQIEDAIDGHVTNTLISLVTLTEIVERVRHCHKPIKEALDKIRRGGVEGEEDDFRYDDIVSDLYGPPPKLQAMSEMMIDGAHEMDVNTTGLGAVFMGEADKDGANTWSAAPANAGATEGAGRVFVGAGSADKNSAKSLTLL